MIPHYGALGYVAAHVSAAVIILAIAATVCWRSGQLPPRILAMAGALAAGLAAMSALLIWLHAHKTVGPIELFGLVPVGVTGAMAAREFLSGFRLTRGRGSEELDQARSLRAE